MFIKKNISRKYRYYKKKDKRCFCVVYYFDYNYFVLIRIGEKEKKMF